MSEGGSRAPRARLTVGNRKHRQPQPGQGRTARVALPCGHVRVTRMDWAASETRSFHARSDMLLTMTHSRHILGHRPCDKETDMQAKQLPCSHHTARRPLSQNPWRPGCPLPEGCSPGPPCRPPELPPSTQQTRGPQMQSRHGPTRPGRGDVQGGEGTSREGGGQAMLSLPEGPMSTGSVV